MAKQPQAQELRPSLVVDPDIIWTPEVQRGAVLKALLKYGHDAKINFDQVLEDLPISFNDKRGILKLFDSGGLLLYEMPLINSLGNGRLTWHGIQVGEEKQSPPFPIEFHFHQHTHSGVHIKGNANISGNIATDQGRTSQGEKKDVDLVKWISTGWKWVTALFGFGRPPLP